MSLKREGLKVIYCGPGIFILLKNSMNILNGLTQHAWLSKIRNQEFRLYISSLTGECAAQKLKNFFLVYGHVYIIWSYKEAKKSQIFDNFSLGMGL